MGKIDIEGDEEVYEAFQLAENVLKILSSNTESIENLVSKNKKNVVVVAFAIVYIKVCGLLNIDDERVSEIIKVLLEKGDSKKILN